MAFGFLKSLIHKISGRSINWDEIEEILIQADLGPALAVEIVESLKKHCSSSDDILFALRDHIAHFFPPAAPEWKPIVDSPYVVLLAGVNGTGKTTSAAKLAHYLRRQRHSVLLVAADTFRAAAIEQLRVWGTRLGIEVLHSQYGGDAASLCYDAYHSAKRRGIQFLICDTAGRLHTKSNLMQELAKISRLLSKQDGEAPHQKLLVVDATTGVNGLVQAKEFHQALGLTGIVLTKLDGSGKGGIAVAISQQLGITPQFIGTGEKPEDFERFERERFIREMI